MPTPKKQKTPPPAAAPKEPKPAVVREPNDMQKLVADIVGDMIARAANQTDMENLLSAVLSHRWKQLHGRSRDAADVSLKIEQIDEFTKEHLDDWYFNMSLGWGDRSGPMPAVTDAATISARIRADLRGGLRSDFDRFLNDATPEEIWLMKDVLGGWENNSLGADDNRQDIALAHAFAETFGQDEHYIKVPENKWSLVTDYLRLLDGNKCRKVA